MSIKLYVGFAEEPITRTVFPAGETCIRLDSEWRMMPVGQGLVQIGLDFESNNDLFDMALVLDAVKRKYDDSIKTITLNMPYIPYARQDRVCNAGESLSVKVLADYINSMGFDKVFVRDSHSDVALALINNVQHDPQHSVALRLAATVNTRGWSEQDPILVSPDAGANKKVMAFAKAGLFHDVVRADKVRDVMSGKILDTQVYSEHVGNRDFLIVDDICDGGRTFIELAKKLRTLTNGKVMLYVTHGIFSAGVEVFDNVIDLIYTSNPVGATGKAAVESGKVSLI